LKAILVILLAVVSTRTALSEAKPERELTVWDLLAEYERLAPINKALHEGEWVTSIRKYPQRLGTFESKTVEDIYFCGDLCPQNATVAMRYADILEHDCPQLGFPLYDNSWGRQYKGCSPLLVTAGRILKSGNDWIFAYRYGDSEIKLSAVLENRSLCKAAGMNVSCETIRDAAQAIVTGAKSRDTLVVLKVEM
jgi:hypothetical protein